jgi:hypothetical protein
MTPKEVAYAVLIATSALDKTNRKKFLENFLFTLEVQFPFKAYEIKNILQYYNDQAL